MQMMCKAKTEDGASSGSRTPEAGQFEDDDGFACTVTIGNAEAMIGDVGEKSNHVDVWLGDSGASHHIKSSSSGMIDVMKCPPGTTIRQVQGTVDVKEWGSVLLQVDGQDGKKLIRQTCGPNFDFSRNYCQLVFPAPSTGDGIFASLRRSGRQMHTQEEDCRWCHDANRHDVNEEGQGHTRLRIVQQSSTLVQHLKVVGCKAFCQYDQKERTGKFSAKAWIGVLVGHSVDTPG